LALTNELLLASALIRLSGWVPDLLTLIRRRYLWAVQDRCFIGFSAAWHLFCDANQVGGRSRGIFAIPSPFRSLIPVHPYFSTQPLFTVLEIVWDARLAWQRT